MAVKFGKIIIPANKEIHNLEVFVVKEETAQKSGLGQLFVVLNIESKEKNLGPKIKELISLAENSYYSSPIIDIESSLELTCQDINNNLNEIFNKPDNWYQRLNLLIGVVKGNNLAMSQIGSFSCYLSRHKKISSVLVSKNEEREKFYFSQLTSGEIKTDDALIVANYALFDYFSLEKINDVLNGLKAEGVAEQLKNLVLDSPKIENVVGLIIKENGTPEEIDEKTIQTKKYLQEFYGSKESMRQLESLEERTGRTMTASLWPSLLKINKFIFGALKKPFQLLRKDKKELKMPVEKEVRQAGRGKKVIGEKMAVISSGVGGIFKTVLKNKKYFLSLIIVLVLVFAGSVVYLSVYKKKADLLKQWQGFLTVAGENKANAEAALIYEDKEKAGELLKQAIDNLNNNWPTEADWQSKFETEKTDLQVMLNKINNIYVGEVSLVADLSANGGQAIDLIKNNGEWQLLSDNGEIYRLDGQNGYSFLFKGNNLKEIWAYKDGSLILLDTDNKFYYLKNFKSGLQNLELGLTDDGNQMAIYNDSLYVLDGVNGTINKVVNWLTKAQSTAWYKDTAELIKDAKEIQIDGNIWLVKDKQIIKIFKGKQASFELGKINVPLGNDLEMYTEKDWNNLYVLDKNNKRLVVVSKENGSVLRQYINEDLIKASSLVVDDKENNALMIVDGKIYKIGVK